MKSLFSAKSLVRTAVSTAVLLAPSFALAATNVVGGVSDRGWFFGISSGNGGGFGGVGCGGTVCGIAENILFLINAVAVPLLFAVSFIFFLYGIANAYIIHPDKPDEGHKLVLYGVIGFAVMISIWGLVNVVTNTFGLGGYYAPELPTSY